MMTILVLNYEFPPIGGGGSLVSYDISKNLAKCGHKVVVVTMQYQNLPAIEHVDGMEIYRIPCIRKKSNVCYPWEQATYIISALFFLRKFFKNNKVDMIHTHFIIPTGAISWYIKKRYHIPYVITAHGSDVIGHNNKRFALLYKILKMPWRSIVKNANTVVSPSGYLLQLMKKTEPCGSYTLIPNGIDTALYGGYEKKNRMLVLCRLQETKGVQVILRAIAEIDFVGWTLDVVGDGPFRKELEALVKKLQLQNKVHFHGWVENRSREHLRLLGEAKIFISASRVENCPVSVLEALCSDCKLILSDISAHRELAQSYAEYFAIDDVKECRKLLETAIRKDYSDKTEMTLDKEQWDWKEIVKKYEAVM